MLKPEDEDEVLFKGLMFVKFKEEGELSKAKIIPEFLRKNKDKTSFSKEIASSEIQGN